MRESNSHQKFWRLLSYHLTNPLYIIVLFQTINIITYLIHFCKCTFKTSYRFRVFWSSPRSISNSQLHVLPHFHLCPIYLVVFKGSYFLRMGYLILRGASRLDAFSVYPFQAWLLCHAVGTTTDTPVVRPSRSSRTKDSSSQISSARAG